MKIRIKFTSTVEAVYKRKKKPRPYKADNYIEVDLKEVDEIKTIFSLNNKDNSVLKELSIVEYDGQLMQETPNQKYSLFFKNSDQDIYYRIVVISLHAFLKQKIVNKDYIIEEGQKIFDLDLEFVYLENIDNKYADDNIPRTPVACLESFDDTKCNHIINDNTETMRNEIISFFNNSIYCNGKIFTLGFKEKVFVDYGEGNWGFEDFSYVYEFYKEDSKKEIKIFSMGNPEIVDYYDKSEMILLSEYFENIDLMNILENNQIPKESRNMDYIKKNFFDTAEKKQIIN